MASLNTTILTGRLTADPELRYTNNEKPVAHFRLAVNRFNKKGENSADFLNCVAWGGLAKVCGDYLKKGRLVAVEGRIKVSSYKDKKGQNQNWTEIVANNIQMLDKAPVPVNK
ncbi:MAG: single-strand DNA-binding protein [Candidatus Saganbacteria bacterium]|uniref:Single-stranded DNA-binding protein n=1 Tax=Candidatus Saganbacteria bacterium TaxID=2575572 RepID=A0A833NYP1_UNCSA|nr:MAG: single-strand DNA-binding protein [Candidatus Saganbacteria bacterium]